MSAKIPFRISPATATLEQIRAWVAERMTGSPEPVPGYFVQPKGARVVRGEPANVHFCKAHADAAHKERGGDPSTCEALDDEPSEYVWTCSTCGIPLRGSLNDEGIEEMLAYHLGEGESPAPTPMSPADWRDLSLCLEDPSGDQIYRIRLVIACSLIAPASRRR